MTTQNRSNMNHNSQETKLEAVKNHFGSNSSPDISQNNHSQQIAELGEDC